MRRRSSMLPRVMAKRYRPFWKSVGVHAGTGGRPSEAGTPARGSVRSSPTQSSGSGAGRRRSMTSASDNTQDQIAEYVSSDVFVVSNLGQIRTAALVARQRADILAP